MGIFAMVSQIPNPKLLSMALKYQVDDKFPSLSLPNDYEQEVSIGELVNSQPLILAFHCVPW